MNDHVLLLAVFKLGLAFVALVLVKLWILYSPDFREWLKDASNADKSFYFGMRFLGVCLLVGLCIQ